MFQYMFGSGWFWLILDVAALALLGAALIYGMRRRRLSGRERHEQEERVHALYRGEDENAAPAPASPAAPRGDSAPQR